MATYSNNVCVGGTPISGGDNSTYTKDKAFDGVVSSDNSNLWASSQTGSISGLAWIGYHFSAPQVISKIKLIHTGAVGGSPSSIKIQGSNDGSLWVDLDVKTASINENVFYFNNNNYYSRYRLLADANLSFGWTWNVKEIEMYRETVNKILISSSSGETESVYNDGVSHIVKSLQSQTEQDFINHGMDDLSSLDPTAEYTKKQYIQNQSIVLGAGKVFEQPIDLNRYKVNKIKFQ